MTDFCNSNLYFWLNQILNKYESWISFLSSVRYWMAFNIERACQSYFGCVQCISGPLGMYRNSLLHEFVEDWYNQTFMGSHCSFGDDRHLTNRVLSLGYATKYTARSKCLTETPITYLRWLNQQTRWSKSYFREWLYNSMWFHKHHLWMTYEAVITGFFPFFLIATAIQLFYQGRLWNILLFLLIVQAVALIKSSFASCLRGNIVMVFMSFYSVLYMSSLLPAKMFAIATINKSGWGTSGRKTIVVNFIGLIPISIWFSILFFGIIYTVILQAKKPFPDSEKIILVVGAVVYASYWVVLLTLYAVLINKCGKRKKETHYDMVLDVWLTVIVYHWTLHFWVIFTDTVFMRRKCFSDAEQLWRQNCLSLTKMGEKKHDLFKLENSRNINSNGCRHCPFTIHVGKSEHFVLGNQCRPSHTSTVWRFHSIFVTFTPTL